MRTHPSGSAARALLALTLLLAAPQRAQEPAPAAPPSAPAPALRDLAPLLSLLRERFDLPALCAVTITSAGPVAAGFSGVRRRGGDALVTPLDRFHLGSCTKAMTATLAALLIAEEKIAFESTLALVLPELALAMTADWRGVTLDQLLSHTAGAPADLLAYPGVGVALTLSKKPLSEVRLALVEAVTASPPLFAPGTSFLYSNMGYVMAGAMLERVGGGAWEDLLRARLFGPLGMSSAGFGAPDALAPSDGEPATSDALCGHDEHGAPAPGRDNPAFIGPAGTVHATLFDWAKFVGLHLRGARGEGGLGLEPAHFAALHRPRAGTEAAYAAGWLTLRRPWSKAGVLAHNGSNTLWLCWVWMAPEEDFAVLVACNQGGDAVARGVDAAAGALIGEHLAARAAAQQDAR